MIAGQAQGRQILFDLAARTDPKAAAAFDKIANQATAANAKIAAAHSNGHAKMTREVELFAGKSIKEWEKVSTGIDRAAAKATKEWETANAKMVAATKNAANAKFEALNKVSEGVMKLGRGYVQAGLIGEENLKKVVDVLLKTEAAINLVRGGIEVYRGLTTAVESYRAAVAAAAAVEVAAAAARGAGGAGGAAAGAAGTASKAGKVAGGVGGIAGFLQWLGLGGIAGTALAGGAAAGGTLVGGKGIKEFAGDVKGIGFGRGARVGSQSDTIAQKYWLEYPEKVLDALGLLGEGSLLGKSLTGNPEREAMENRADEQRGQRSERDKLNALDIQKRSRASDVMFGGLRSQREISGLTGADPMAEADKLRAAAVERLKAAEKDVVDARKVGLESERAAIAERKTAADALLEIDKERLRLVKERTDKEKAVDQKKLSDPKNDEADRKGDLERFAGLDVLERQTLARAKEKLERGEGLSKSEGDLAGQFKTLSDKVHDNRSRVGSSEDVLGLFGASAAPEQPGKLPGGLGAGAGVGVQAAMDRLKNKDATTPYKRSEETQRAIDVADRLRSKGLRDGKVPERPIGPFDPKQAREALMNSPNRLPLKMGVGAGLGGLFGGLDGALAGALGAGMDPNPKARPDAKAGPQSPIDAIRSKVAAAKEKADAFLGKNLSRDQEQQADKRLAEKEGASQSGSGLKVKPVDVNMGVDVQIDPSAVEDAVRNGIKEQLKNLTPDMQRWVQEELDLQQKENARNMRQHSSSRQVALR